MTVGAESIDPSSGASREVPKDDVLGGATGNSLPNFGELAKDTLYATNLEEKESSQQSEKSKYSRNFIERTEKDQYYWTPVVPVWSLSSFEAQAFTQSKYGFLEICLSAEKCSNAYSKDLLDVRLDESIILDHEGEVFGEIGIANPIDIKV